MTACEAPKKKLLGIVGSCRRLGNCELLVKEVARHVPDCDLSLVRLPALKLMPCRGCYRCLDEGVCPIEDDLPFLKGRMASADLIVIASPVYFLGVHGSVKALLDRAFSFYPLLEKMREKPTVLALTYGIGERVGAAPQALSTLGAFLGLDVKATAFLQAALPGDVLSKKNLSTAEKLGKALFRKGRRARSGRGCPFCGSGIVRMRRKDFVCTLCHGSFTIDAAGKARRVEAGWDVGDIGFVRDHREWLLGMKARFIERRREILKATLPYKDMGRWVEP